MSTYRPLSHSPMPRIGISLSTLIQSGDLLEQIQKTSLCSGDYLLIKTCNSVYTIQALPDGSVLASGGWFDRRGKSPMKVRITGCTWGGSAIKMDIAAAKGLCLEFSNKVTTTPIQTFVVLPQGCTN